MIRFAALAALAAVAGAASAQGPVDYTPTGLTLKGGVVLPLDSTLTDVDNLFMNIGIEYLFDRPLLPRGESFFSLEYWTNSFSDQEGTVIPITVNHRFYQDDAMVPGGRTYWYFGLGAAIIDVASSSTSIAARIGVGKELGQNIIFETGLTLSDKAGGARANAVGFTLGYRF